MTGAEYAGLLRASQYEAHKALFNEYVNYVYTIVWARIRSVGSIEDAEECVSDVFADVYLHLEDGIYEGDLKAIITVICKRRAVDAYRKLNRKSEIISFVTDEELQNISDNISVEESAEINIDNSRLLDAVEKLGEPDSTIVIQKYFYERSSKDIGKMLDMRSSAVRMRCSRALKRLKTILSDLEG